MHRWIPAFLALTLTAAAPDPAAPPDTKARVDAVFKEFDRSDSPGCALGVFRGGRIIYARGYGMANLELGAANAPQSVFDIGSTSKQFTAFSIQLLARDGRLSLDDDIRKWVPEIPDYGRTITIRNLIYHTGGLRDYLELLSLQGVAVEDLTTDADALAMLARQKAPNFAPGEEHLYSNSGYFLMSVIVKRASGQSLRDFAAERIFAPLGMRHTQYNDSHLRIIPNRATGYGEAEGGGFEIAMSDWEQTGDGAVLTTVEDLLRWDENFYEPKVGDRKVLDAMLTGGTLNSGEKLQYASALYVSTYRGLPTVSHGGSWAGYRAQLLRFPEQHFSVACLCNLRDAGPSRLAQQVAEIYLGSLMKSEAPKAEPENSGQARPAVAPWELARLSGAYRNTASGQIVALSVRENGLVGDARGRSFKLVPAATGRFRIEGLPGGRHDVEFVTAVSGARPRMNVTVTADDGDVERESFEPVDLWSPAAGELPDFAGSYASEELGTVWRLALEDGKLVIRHREIPDKALSPTVSDTFTLEGMGIAFERDAAGKITGFRLDQGRVRGILFVKQPAG